VLAAMLTVAVSGFATAPVEQRPASEASPGRPVGGVLTDRVACQSDPTQTYTLFTPAGYPGGRRWPVLIVLDPRGRGRAAAEIFAEAAAALGWVIISSDNTSSDGPMAPNVRAVNAIWRDVNARDALDLRRLYVAGFSGTVAVAWGMAASGARPAGLVAVGAPLRPQVTATGEGFALFGAAGRRDFNYLEMRDLLASLEGRNIPRRLEHFAGEHEWLPPELAATALGWFEVRAMKAGTRSRDPELAGRLLEAERRDAATLEQEGRLLEAAARLRAVVEAFDGVAPVEEDRRHLAAIVSGAPHAEAVKQDRRLDQWERALRPRVAGAADHVADADEVMGPAEAANVIQVPMLRGRLSRSPPESDAAARLLNLAAARLGYYKWRDYMEQGAFRRAASLQEIAARIWPESAAPYYRLALSRARAGDGKRALDALEEAARRGMRRLELLDGEPAFDAIRSDPRFAALRGQMR
jgi:tetratricopeptide (TPR) repeat protein